MNDNLLVVEQNSHDINYNVGDMYENYFENYTPAQLNRTVKEGARLSNIKLEYMILRNSDTNKNILFCYFGDLFMSTSVNDYTWIIYGFIVDGIYPYYVKDIKHVDYILDKKTGNFLKSPNH